MAPVKNLFANLGEDDTEECKQEIFVKLNKSLGNCSGWLPEHDLTWCIMLVSWHVLRTDEQDMWSSLEMSY